MSDINIYMILLLYNDRQITWYVGNTGKGKKSDVDDKRVYRIFWKFIGFIIFLSNIFLKKILKLYTII